MSQVRSANVLVWACPEGALDAPQARAEAWAMVSPVERARLEAVVHKPDGAQRQRQGLLSRALCRRTLSLMRPKLAPGDWPLSHRPSGAPYVQDSSAWQGQQPVSFSLSHTHGMVVCAAGTDAALGVDVERMTRPARPERIAKRYFAAQEYQRLMAQRPGVPRQQAFLLLWTLKEAYLKLLGQGLSALKASMAFDFDAEGEVFDVMPKTPLERLWTQSRVIAGTHRLAIVVRTPADAAPAWAWRFGWRGITEAGGTDVFVRQGVDQDADSRPHALEVV